MKTLNGLKRGDLVKHKTGGIVYVVTGNYGGRVTAVNSIDLTNPHEWDKIEL